jgi:hypothetical protein
MRSVSRVFLLVLILLVASAPAILAEHVVADCPLTLVGQSAPASQWDLSPHGIFRNGSVIYALRGQTLTTLSVIDTGELVVGREDFLSNLSAAGLDGGVAYSNGYLFVSSGAGLEIYDLRNTRPGTTGLAPVKVTRVSAPHYRRLVIFGNVLVGLHPASELPCTPVGTSGCFNTIDLWSITTLSSPTHVHSISSGTPQFVGFEAIAIANGFLYATGMGGTHAWDITNPAAPLLVRSNPTRGTFLASDRQHRLAVGQDTLVAIFTVGPGHELNLYRVARLPSEFSRANAIRFHPEAWLSEERLITLIDEVDPMTLKPARTIAFDVFDFKVPFVEGHDKRIYENVSYVESNEVLHNPIAVGPYVYVNGSITGLQVWGACGEIAGRIELSNATHLPCGGAEIHGWISARNKINSIELFLGNQSLGFATITRPRTDIISSRDVWGWAISVNLDGTPEGEHLIRAVATDSAGNRRQFASMRALFPGPGEGNCTTRRRATSRGR